METNVVTHKYNSKQQKQYLNNNNNNYSISSSSGTKTTPKPKPLTIITKNNLSAGNSRITSKPLFLFYLFSYFQSISTEKYSVKYFSDPNNMKRYFNSHNKQKETLQRLKQTYMFYIGYSLNCENFIWKKKPNQQPTAQQQKCCTANKITKFIVVYQIVWIALVVFCHYLIFIIWKMVASMW